MPVYVNADTGRVTGIVPESRDVIFRLDSGVPIRVKPHRWVNTRYEAVEDTQTGELCLEQREIGWFTQLPLRLAYAVTIHKARGITLDRTHISLGNGMFAPGQLYTALSCCRRMDALSVDRPLEIADVIVDPAVRAFHADVERRAAEHARLPVRRAPSPSRTGCRMQRFD